MYESLPQQCVVSAWELIATMCGKCIGAYPDNMCGIYKFALTTHAVYIQELTSTTFQTFSDSRKKAQWATLICRLTGTPACTSCWTLIVEERLLSAKWSELPWLEMMCYGNYAVRTMIHLMTHSFCLTACDDELSNKTKILRSMQMLTAT